MVELVDLPGIYDLHGFADDEQVVRHFLEHDPRRPRRLVTQRHADRSPDQRWPCSCKRPRRDLRGAAQHVGRGAETRHQHRHRRDGAGPGAAGRADQREVRPRASPRRWRCLTRALATATGGRSRGVARPPRRRRRIETDAAAVLKASVVIPERLPAHLTDRIDRVLLHPWLGLPLFFAVMYCCSRAVFLLGEPLQDALQWGFEALFARRRIEPLLAFLPAAVQGLLLDGIYNGVATVAAFVPLIVLFFLFMAMVEDSGYLSRAAFLMDALMAQAGAGRSRLRDAADGLRLQRARADGHARDALARDAPADDAGDPVLAVLGAPAGVPVPDRGALHRPGRAARDLFACTCSASPPRCSPRCCSRGASATTSPSCSNCRRTASRRCARWRCAAGSRCGTSCAARPSSSSPAWCWSGCSPTCRAARPRQRDTTAPACWARCSSRCLAPIGIDEQLTVALIFGFVAKEIVIGALRRDLRPRGACAGGRSGHRLDWVQAYSFMLFTLIYTPCLSTIATLRAESRSVGFTTLSVAWSLLLAWLASFAFYQAARHLGY